MLKKIIYCFLFITHSTLSSRILDSPIIIERPSSSHIEWNELILEYNPDSSPIPNITISLQISMTAFKYNPNDHTMHVIMEINQNWIDHRLVFHGEKQIPIPESIRIWQPDTIIHNSVTDIIRKKSLFLSPNGSVQMVERRDADVICETKCLLAFRSFAHRGADSISYQLESFIPSTNDTKQSISKKINSEILNRSYSILVYELHNKKETQYSFINPSIQTITEDLMKMEINLNNSNNSNSNNNTIS